VVLIAGCEEGLLPLAVRQPLSETMQQAHWEEERRLLYVGMTRAGQVLYLSWCRSRSLYGGAPEKRHASPFLAELPATTLTPVPTSPKPAPKKPIARQLLLFS
jgi:DNA helicase-2/ATP-dependent DNA helicase PcrA